MGGCGSPGLTPILQGGEDNLLKETHLGRCLNSSLITKHSTQAVEAV